MHTVVSFLGQFSKFPFFNQSLLAMASKSSIVLLARNSFQSLPGKVSASLFASQESGQAFACWMWMRGNFPIDLLSLEKISLFAKHIAFSALTLKKVVNPQRESFVVTERYCMPCRRFEKTNWANSLYSGSNNGST